MDWKSVLGLIFILLMVLVFSGVLDNVIDSILDKLYKRGGWLPRFVSKKAKNAADKIDAEECSTSTLSIMTKEKKKNNKTMDYEKKYKEALANMQELYNFMKYMSSTDAQYTTMSLENAFSELRESDDERSRKALIDVISEWSEDTCFGRDNVSRNVILAWLEKQKPTTDIQNLTWEDIEKIGEFINIVQNENPNGIGAECLYTDVLERFLDGKQTKRKPINDTDEEIVEAVKDTSVLDLVEPKFKVGDWIVKNGGKDCFSDGSYVLQITDIDCNRYKLSNGCYLIEPFADTYRIWTIQDAKDGDVLASNNGNTFIYHKHDNNYVYYHCSINYFDNITINSSWNVLGIKPATKEQRDLLFQKMKEAGYEWDAENKELRKIKQKSAENSEKPSGNVIEKEDMTEYNKGFECGKQRVLKYPEEFGLCKNSAWSEEDKGKLLDVKCIIDEIWHCQYVRGEIDRSCEELESLWHWLDNIWQRVEYPQNTWKPSEEQLINFAAILNDHRGNYVITSLYDDLKKL